MIFPFRETTATAACLPLQVAVAVFNIQEGALLRTFLGNPESPLTIRLNIVQYGGSAALLHHSTSSHLSITHLFSGIDLSQYNRIIFLAA